MPADAPGVFTMPDDLVYEIIWHLRDDKPGLAALGRLAKRFHTTILDHLWAEINFQHKGDSTTTTIMVRRLDQYRKLCGVLRQKPQYAERTRVLGLMLPTRRVMEDNGAEDLLPELLGYFKKIERLGLHGYYRRKKGVDIGSNILDPQCALRATVNAVAAAMELPTIRKVDFARMVIGPTPLRCSKNPQELKLDSVHIRWPVQPVIPLLGQVPTLQSTPSPRKLILVGSKSHFNDDSRVGEIWDLTSLLELEVFGLEIGYSVAAHEWHQVLYNGTKSKLASLTTGYLTLDYEEIIYILEHCSELPESRFSFPPTLQSFTLHIQYDPSKIKAPASLAELWQQLDAYLTTFLRLQLPSLSGLTVCLPATWLTKSYEREEKAGMLKVGKTLSGSWVDAVQWVLLAKAEDHFDPVLKKRVQTLRGGFPRLKVEVALNSCKSSWCGLKSMLI